MKEAKRSIIRNTLHNFIKSCRKMGIVFRDSYRFIDFDDSSQDIKLSKQNIVAYMHYTEYTKVILCDQFLNDPQYISIEFAYVIINDSKCEEPFEITKNIIKCAEELSLLYKQYLNKIIITIKLDV